MSEFFKSRLDVAHALIDEQRYDEAVEIIQNLKIRIHTPELLTKVTIHDNEVEKEYNNRYLNISQHAGDPYESFNRVMENKKWRAQEYLKYYDLMSIENDL